MKKQHPAANPAYRDKQGNVEDVSEHAALLGADTNQSNMSSSSSDDDVRKAFGEWLLVNQEGQGQSGEGPSQVAPRPPSVSAQPSKQPGSQIILEGAAETSQNITSKATPSSPPSQTIPSQQVQSQPITYPQVQPMWPPANTQRHSQPTYSTQNPCISPKNEQNTLNKDKSAPYSDGLQNNDVDTLVPEYDVSSGGSSNNNGGSNNGYMSPSSQGFQSVSSSALNTPRSPQSKRVKSGQEDTGQVGGQKDNGRLPVTDGPSRQVQEQNNKGIQPDHVGVAGTSTSTFKQLRPDPLNEMTIAGGVIQNQ